MPRSISGVCVVLAAVMVTGCTSPRAILKTSGPTMQELIEGGQRTGPRDRTRHRLTDTERRALTASVQRQAHRAVELHGYTRTAEREIEQLFPRHPNPTITIYVYPHLATASHAPVPGYTTAITLYPADQYALPGEQPMPQR